MTYRSDADVIHSYMRVIPKTNIKFPISLINEEYQTWINLTRKKAKLAALVVSHCDTPSKREYLVAKLKRFLNIDIFGGCGTKSCPPGITSEDSCFTGISNTYKFYLAFENSLCDEYVSEKFFRAMNLTLIPVVFYYLKFLDGNEEEYVKYFWWRKHYKVA
ncbi:alpha-(1,3)-fucosyltransferase C [Folsomia candida]|nr:alpha-(1,3)-fucosyltransferase C [Folsomia candida]